MYLIKKGVKNLRKMRIFENFFSQPDKIIIIIIITLVNFKFYDFLRLTIKIKNGINVILLMTQRRCNNFFFICFIK